MKKIIISMALIISLSLCAGELRQEWLEIDRALLKSLVETLNSECGHLDCLTTGLPGAQESSNESLGFGARRHEYAWYGGHTTVRIVVVSFKKRILMIKADVVTSRRQLLIEKILGEDEVLKQGFWRLFRKREVADTERGSFRHYELKEQEFGLLADAVASSLGEPREIEPEESVAEDYQFLFYPLEIYDYGVECYYGMEAPVGRQAVNRLVEKKKIKLIRNISRGYNPEGRLYAIEALHTLSLNGGYTLTAGDKRLFKKVLSLNILIRYCGGCMVSRVKARDLRDSVLWVPSQENPVIVP